MTEMRPRTDLESRDWNWHGSAAERLKLEEIFRTDDSLLSILIHQSRDGIVIIDEDSKVFDANRRYAEMLGYTMDEVRQLYVWDWDIQFTKEQLLEMVRQVDHSGDHFETRHRRKDGTVYDVDISTTATVFRGQKLTLCSCRDITARKAAERALQQKNEEMEHLLYAISHDLKSPLVTINSFLDLIRQSLAEEDLAQANADIDFIQDAAGKMGQLLDAVLKLSRLGRMENRQESFVAGDLVEKCLRALAGPIQSQQVEVDVSGLSLSLHGDLLRLEQLWQNLIENAVKYMGGQPRPRIELGVERRNHEPVFFVRDNGVGIAPEHAEQIFELFVQLDSNSEGSGLGLAMANKIAKLYGGRIWVEPGRDGEGSCFCFTLPGAVSLA